MNEITKVYYYLVGFVFGVLGACVIGKVYKT